MWVIVRVHDDTAHFRTLSEPAAASCFTDFHELMVTVTHGTDRCTANFQDFTYFARRQADRNVFLFFTEQLSFCTSSTNELSAFAWFQLDVVDYSTYRDVLQRHSVTDFDVGAYARFDHVAHFQTFRSDDVAFFAIGIMDQSDVRSPVWIIFDRSNAAWNSIFVPFEVDDAVFTFMPAAVVTNSNFTLVVAASRFAQRRKQRFLRLIRRNFFEGRHAHGASCRGCRFVLFDWHEISLLTLNDFIPIQRIEAACCPQSM
ncbi:hypothetical protein D3C81_1141750 [compost metagenome]